MKKVLAIFMLLVLLLSLAPLNSFADVVKDETVYALMDAGGNVYNVLVVSHIDTPEDGEYVDFGDYVTTSAMLLDSTPTVEDGQIIWDLPADPAGFYAVGEMENAQLPFTVSFSYTLGGEDITPEALAGQSGSVGMTVSVRANDQSGEAFRKAYMAQVQIPLSVSVCFDIDAPGATNSTLVGKTQTVTYTVLPGQDADFALAFTTEAFEMDSISIVCAAMDIESMLGMDISGLTDQIEAMKTGVNELADGTQALADGIATMAEQASAYLDGTAAYIENAQSILGNVSQLSQGLDTVAASGASLVSAAEQLQSGVGVYLALLPEAQRTGIEGNFTQLSEGLAAYAEAVSTLASQAAQLAQGADTLHAAGAQITGASGETAEGDASPAAQLADGLNALKEGAEQLALGQAQFAAALEEATGMLEGYSFLQSWSGEIPSFASPEHAARSVQFVYYTDAVTIPQQEAEAVKEDTNQTFWERIKALFQ